MLLYNIYFNIILFFHAGHSNLDFNWCSVFIECFFRSKKGLNGQNDSSDTPKKETGPPPKKKTKTKKTKQKQQNKLREDKFVVKEKWLHQN